jgi:hypothetical protein
MSSLEMNSLGKMLLSVSMGVGPSEFGSRRSTGMTGRRVLSNLEANMDIDLCLDMVPDQM